MADKTETETCETRIGERLASRELSYRMLFTRDAPDVEDDLAFAAAYIEHATSELGFELSDDARVVVERFTAGLALLDAAGTGDEEFLQTLIVAEDNLYDGDTMQAAVQDILTDIDVRTQDKRTDAVSEGPLDVAVKITLRIDLSTGGPADYITADLDPQSRQVSGVQYHFADWYDHAERSVEDDSSLGQLAAYFGEIVQVPGTDE